MLAAVAAALLGVAFSGAALPALLRDPGAAVRWGLPATEVLTELAGSVTLGALVLAVCVLPRRAAVASTRTARAGVGTADGRAYPRSTLLAGFAAGVWTLLSIAHLVLTYASVAGRTLDSATFGAELGVFVTQIDLGRTLLLITTVAAVVTALALVVATPTGAAWTAAIVLVALWQQAQLGHAAGASGHDIATSSMVVHLVGAAIWIGALAALALLVRRVGTDLPASVARYSAIAGWCFAAVAVSGLVNGLLRTSGWSDLTSSYGLLLLDQGGPVRRARAARSRAPAVRPAAARGAHQRLAVLAPRARRAHRHGGRVRGGRRARGDRAAGVRGAAARPVPGLPAHRPPAAAGAYRVSAGSPSGDGTSSSRPRRSPA